LPNNNQGIYFDGEATTNTLRNNLSSSNGYGLRLGTLSLPGTENNTIIGNLFGTDFSGTQPLGNTHDGVIVNSPNNTIGGNGVSEVNVSSDNGNNGVTIYSTNNVTVQNNHIGVDIIGNKAMGNGNNGVQIGLQGALSGASNNTI
jgi:hypothetical protein